MNKLTTEKLIASALTTIGNNVKAIDVECTDSNESAYVNLADVEIDEFRHLEKGDYDMGVATGFEFKGDTFVVYTTSDEIRNISQAGDEYEEAGWELNVKERWWN